MKEHSPPPGKADVEFLAGILGGAAEAIIAIDRDQAISLFNRGAEITFGYAAEEVLGRPITMLMPQNLRPRHGDLVRAFANEDAAARFMGQHGRIFGLRKDGSEFPAEASILKLESGKRHAFIAILRDVSEQEQFTRELERKERKTKEIAAHLQVILDAIPANIAVLDHEGSITKVNEAWIHFAIRNGCAQSGLGLGRNYLTLCRQAAGPNSDNADQIAEKLANVLGGISIGFTAEYPCHAPAERRWFQMICAPAHGGEGVGAVIVHIDITAMKVAQEILGIERQFLEYIADDKPLQSVFAAACAAIELLDPAAICSIALLEGNPRIIRLMPGANVPPEFCAYFQQLPAADTSCPCGDAIRTGIDILLSDAEQDGPWPEFRRMMRAAGLRSCWSVPISRRSGEIAAAFAVLRRVPGPIEPAFRQAVERLTDVVGIAIDRSLSHGELRRSEERYALVFEASNEGLWDWDLVTGAVFRSPRLYEILGLSRDEVAPDATLSNDWFLGLIHPEDRQRVRDIVLDYLEDRAAIYAAEYRIVRRDGSQAWVSERGVAVKDKDGSVRRMVGSVADITGRKRAEEATRALERKLGRIAKNVPGALFERVLRPDGAIAYPYMSEGISRVVGRNIGDDGAEVNGATLFSFVHPEDRERVAQDIQRSADEMSKVEIEFRIFDENGNTRWLQSISEPWADADGSVVWDGLLLDITDRKKAEEERGIVEEQLRHAQKMESLGTLAGGIAHDINNALVPVIGLTDLALEDTQDNALVQENLKLVLAGSNRIRDLVQQILAFSRKDSPTREVVDLGSEVIQPIQQLRSMVPRTVKLTVETYADPLLVSVDRIQLHQVVMNLVSNALGAMAGEKGSIRIVLGSKVVSAGGDNSLLGLSPGVYAKFTVADTGRGMPPEIVSRIFDPFFTTKPVGEGTGLGLSVARGIVESHGGTITVDSAVGEGTCFDIYLPIVHLGTSGN